MYICEKCDSIFKTSRTLRQHQQKALICKKYEKVLFTCKLCNYRTEGLRKIEDHIKTCKVEPPVVTQQDQHITEMRRQLEIERVRCQILTAMLSSTSNIPVRDLCKTVGNNIHLFDLSLESKIYLREHIPEQIGPEIDEIKTKVVKDKSSHTYRKVKKIVVIPEPDSTTLHSVIDSVDKLKELETSALLCGDTIQDIKKQCTKLIEQINEKRLYNKYLTKLKTTRSKLLGPLTISEYKKVLEDHNRKLEEVFLDKQQNTKKIGISILRSLTPIDSRLLRYPGFIDTQLDAECREKLKKVLKHGGEFPKEFTSYSIEGIAKSLTNYGVAVFTIERLIKWRIINPYNFFNVMYVAIPKSTERDPYAFYTLSGVNKGGGRKWDMNCRLEDFTSDIISVLQPYMIGVFRSLYFHLFNDNVYRPDYSQLSAIATEDCEQLAQNIILLAQPVKFCNMLRKLFVKECTYRVTKNDSFNLTGDDILQRKRFGETEKVEIITTVSQLFDDITDEQAVNFYKSRNVV